MARIDTLTNFLTDVADSIRSKTGKSDAIACEDFDTEIESISGGGSQKNRLPDAYQEVEYIQSSGTQYFDTGYYASGNSQYEFKFSHGSTSGVVFGAYNSAWTTGSGYYHNSSSAYYEYVHYYSNNGINKSGSTTDEYEYTIDKGYVYFKGTLIYSLNTKSFTLNYPTYILAGNWAGSKAQEPISARLYYFRIRENCTAIHNYIPCYRKSDGVIGLYDLVENKFITNAGTGTFEKGPDHDTPIANLQDKSVTITENTTTEITADSGYDGLGLVSVTTNVPSGSGEIEVGCIFSDWDLTGYPHSVKYVGRDIVVSYYFSPLSNGSLGITSKLENVVLPNSLTTINQNAFENCINLTNINLPNSLTSLGNSAFYNCQNLQLNNLPNSLTSLGNYAFYNCQKITINKIPEPIKSISQNCFQNCSLIENMTLNLMYRLDSSSIFNGCTSLKMVIGPKIISQIGYNCFQNCTSLTKIDMPLSSGVGNYTFYNCKNLEKIALPLCHTINSSAFGNCTNLKSLNALKFVKSMVSNSATTGAFYNCTSLKAIWIGNKITSNSLGRYVFNGCIALEYIYIDLPRATVETFTNYQYAFMNDTTKTGIIICNDDSDFITANEFDELYGRNDISTIMNCDNLFDSVTYSTNYTIDEIQTIIKYLKPTTAYKMFNNLKTLNGFMDMTNLDVSNCTTMESMFENCNNVTGYNVSNWDTSKVTTMQSMFISYASNNLGTMTLDLSNFDISNVTNTRYMFYKSYYLSELDISSFDFTNVTTFDNMFTSCGTSVSGGCKVYVKDTTAQNWVLTASNGHPSSWTTDNVIIAGSEADLRS